MFIGGNPDLMNWFRAFVGWEGHDEVIDNRPQPPTGRVSLSNCRGLGPSYRLLPKRVCSFPILFSISLSRVMCGAGVREMSSLNSPLGIERCFRQILHREQNPNPQPLTLNFSSPTFPVPKTHTTSCATMQSPFEVFRLESECSNVRGKDIGGYDFIPHGNCIKRKLQEAEVDAEGLSRAPKRRNTQYREYLAPMMERADRYQERLKPCSGRDEMCNEVLNDDWASHPTWASEDSGFVAHRKNVFEEALHRIEEERHDYDFNIEANAKVIQLLEPIGQNLLSMNAEERMNFRMPIGLGGQSQAIYKRVLKKIYGDRGPEVAADLFKDPSAVLPIVLSRLKQKDEEWRFTQVDIPPMHHCPRANDILQREWEKVWHAQTEAMYLKSLDHMGIQSKQADKRNFSVKHLVDAIKTKHEEQRRQRATRGRTPKYQFSFQFDDQDVIMDVLRFMMIYVANTTAHSTYERRRIFEFYDKFFTAFFGLPADKMATIAAQTERGSPDEDDEDATPTELPNGARGRRQVNGKKNDLRRGVLDKGRNGTKGRGQKEGSATGSKESTPDVESVGEEEGQDIEEQAVEKVTDDRWARHPPDATAVQGSPAVSATDADKKTDKPYQRDDYKLFCNQTIYVLFSIFQTLYRRLKAIKDSEDEARKEGLRAAEPKPARDLNLVPTRHEETLPTIETSYYAKALSLIESYISGSASGGTVEDAKYQDWLRRHYLSKGWTLYTIADLLKIICRLAATCSSMDAKEKTPDLIEQFYKNRENKETTYNSEINMRKQAEKYIKDGELFLIHWVCHYSLFPL